MAFNQVSLKPQTLRPTILSGWKEIANYLGMGVRTVQRYERELRLPVRRLAGKSRGSVVALTSDVDAWVSQSPMRPLALVSLSSQQVDDLKSGLSTMRSLHAQAKELESALKLQHMGLETGIYRIAQSLSGSDVLDAEKRRRTAMQQKERATEMIETARNMSDQAIKMRKPAHLRLI